MREAPSIVLASRLLAEGADVRAWDPVVHGDDKLPNGVQIVGSILEAVQGADAAVIVTEWAELKELASPEVHAAMATPLIVDGRNLLDPEETRRAGFTYEGIGRPAAPPDTVPQARAPPPGRRRRGSDHSRRRQGRAARRRCRRTPEVARRGAGKPLAAYQVGRLARAGVTRVIFACAAGEGSKFVDGALGHRPGDRRRRGAGAARARRRHQVRGAAAAASVGRCSR